MNLVSFCRFCGYDLIIGEVASTESTSREINIGGAVGVGPFNVSLNPFKYIKKKEITSSHLGDKCIK